MGGLLKHGTRQRGFMGFFFFFYVVEPQLVVTAEENKLCNHVHLVDFPVGPCQLHFMLFHHFPV